MNELHLETSPYLLQHANNPFNSLSQLYGRFWVHYYNNKKSKYSGSVSFFYNREVPELSQEKSPEVRFTFQGIYYIIKGKTVFTNRLRIDDRIIGDSNNSFNIVFRFREMLKLVYPISKSQNGKGSFYGIASEEVLFKTKGPITGDEFFDRNCFSFGIGYSFTDFFQVQVSYLNDYLPREINDKMYHSIGTSIIFNDLITALKKKQGNLPSH